MGNLTSPCLILHPCTRQIIQPGELVFKMAAMMDLIFKYVGMFGPNNLIIREVQCVYNHIVSEPARLP